MKKFRVTVTRTDEYEIELDEELLNDPEKGYEGESFMQMYNKHFSEADEERLSEILAEYIFRNGADEAFFEGFGNIKRLYASGEPVTLYGNGFRKISEEEYQQGITVKLVDYDDYYDIFSEEITE